MSNAFEKTGASTTEEQLASIPRRRRDPAVVEFELSTFHSAIADATTPSSFIAQTDIKSGSGLGIDEAFMDVEPRHSKAFCQLEDVEHGQVSPIEVEAGGENVRDSGLQIDDGARGANERRLRDVRRREEMRRDEHEAFKRQI